MAREKYEIKDIIVAELTGLGLSESSTAIWTMLVNAVVSAIYVFEQIMDVFKADIESMVAAKRIGSRTWYVEQAKAFQLNDALSFSTDGLIYYPIIDETKRIIVHANAIQAIDVLTIKVAKLDGQVLSPLTDEELLQFTKYMNDVMIAGTKMQVVSLLTDIIDITATVYYNPIYSTDQMNTAISEALFIFKSTFNFDNYFVINDFVEYMRKIDGIDDFIISTITGTSGEITENIVRRYEIKAGYFNFDDNCVFTLQSIL